MITIATLKASGLSAEQIVAVLEADEADQLLAAEARREKNRDRMRASRAAHSVHNANNDAQLPPPSPSPSSPLIPPNNPLPLPPPCSSLRSEVIGSADPIARPKFKYPAAFEGWWLAYPKSPIMSKKEAAAAWSRLPEDDRLRAVGAIAPYRKFLAEKPDHPAVHACRFLSQRRFEGFDAVATGPPDDTPKGWRPGLPTHEELKRKYAQNGQLSEQVGEVLGGGAGPQPSPQISGGDKARNGRMVQLGSLFPPSRLQAIGDDAGRAEPDENGGVHGPGSVA